MASTVNCRHCQLPTYGPAFCGNCGEVLPPALQESLYAAASKASSGGRIPMWADEPRTRTTFTDSLGAHARREYLTAMDDDGPGFIVRVAADERLVAACEQDRDEAHQELRNARVECPEQPEGRALSPEREQAWRRAQNAEVRAARADDALARARTRLARSLAEFEEIAKPLPHWVNDGDGLAPIDRDRRS